MLILHGFIRGGGDLIEGFKIMYEKDFLRRMVGGNAENFNPVYAESLNASIVEVVLKYFNWTTPIIVGIKFTGNFCVLILLDFILLIYAIKNDAQRKLLAAMLMVFALPAISWFIFGKAQSYIHTHMDFVLWYFGFVAVAFYIPVLTIKKHFERT